VTAGLPVLHEIESEEQRLPVLPALQETDSDENGCPSYFLVPSSWSCHACTLMNHGWLTSCEVCNTSRNADIALPQTSPVLHKHTLLGLSTSVEWPALPDASRSFEDDQSWVDVESVASWQDVNGTEEYEVDSIDGDTTGVVVDAASIATEVRATAPRLWSAIVGSNMSSTKVPAVVAAPGLRRTAPRKQANIKEDIEHDVFSDELDIRRMRDHRRSRAHRKSR